MPGAQAPQAPRRRRATKSDWLRTCAINTGLVVVYFLAPFGQQDDPLPLPLATAVSVLVAFLLSVAITRRIVGVLEGSTSVGLPELFTVLVVVVVAFSTVYFLLERSDPGQVAGLHTRLDSLYLTLSTLGTVGYGDVHPAGQAARAIACIQLAFNAILVTGLVRAIFYQAQTRRAPR